MSRLEDLTPTTDEYGDPAESQPFERLAPAEVRVRSAAACCVLRGPSW